MPGAPIHLNVVPVIEVTGPASGVTVTLVVEDELLPLHPLATTVTVAGPENALLHVTNALDVPDVIEPAPGVMLQV